MQQEVLLVGVRLEELLAHIGAIFENKLSQNYCPREKDDPSIKYLSRKEVALLLKISLPTLHEWTKIKLLQSYKIGNRVLYSREEIENAVVKTGNIIKYKRNHTS